MPKNRADYIREELSKDFEAPAQDIADRLRKRGVIIDPQHVYQVRSDLRKRREVRTQNALQTRQENDKPLAEYIMEVLDSHPDGLSDRELATAIKKAGYKSRSADFLDVLRKKLYELTEKGSIVKTGLQYALSPSEKAARQKEVKSEVKGVLVKHQLGQADKQDEAAAEIAAQVVNYEQDYFLLRQAVVDYAKSKGFKNADAFPDTLIQQRRAINDQEAQYHKLFESGGEDGTGNGN